ncbi:sugar ABC transporter ATP-binding protein [Spirochaetia bacterium]|nr:sugar ABC transporter ATP-binding protein [Spirochaetia bacterium]
MAEIVYSQVCKTYEHNGTKKKKHAGEGVRAVKDLSFTINDGEFVGILGPSGCGKSTTLRMTAGLEEITAGEIIIDGKVINHVTPKDRGIGLAFEDYALYPPLNVYDNIAFCLKAKNVSKEEVHQRITKIAPLMKLEDLLDAKVASLSGGQKQRVNIARALVRNPKVLLLDEPLSHLDGKMRQTLRTEIKRLHHNIQCTTVLVTHDQMEAMSLSDRVCIMNEGFLQQYGTPDEIFNDPVNLFVANFIGEPPMNLLQTQIRKEGDKYSFTFKDTNASIPMPETFKSILKEGNEFVLGIRPTYMDVVHDDNWDARFEVEIFENLGEEKNVSVRLGDNFLTVMTTKDIRFKKGDELRLKIQQKNLLLFDVKTGERLRPAG